MTSSSEAKKARYYADSVVARVSCDRCVATVEILAEEDIPAGSDIYIVRNAGEKFTAKWHIPYKNYAAKGKTLQSVREGEDVLVYGLQSADVDFEKHIHRMPLTLR